ncbi:MAG: CHAD domain-containing protein [Melioribacteraceae bacterium]|nr:MAG: CHAD domain-containing protein [Melioribacteraceae bacterium]
MINKIGHEYIKGQIRKIRANKKGVAENKDIEYLHKVRVSSRKILSAIYLFREYFKKDGFLTWEKMVLQLAKSLGKPRDLDVHIEFLEKFMKEHPKQDVAAGVNRIKVRMRQKREKYGEATIGSINEFLAATKSNPLEKVFETKFSTEPNVKEEITGLIEIKLSRIKMYEPYIYNIHNIEELHELRKANKLLRYALEVFNPYYENKLLPFINEITHVQDKVGLIHDCDIWFEILPDFIAEEKNKTIKFYGEVSPFYDIEPGIRYFEDTLKQIREEMYHTFIKEWNELNARNFVPDLLAILRGEEKEEISKEENNLLDGNNSFLSV